MTIHRHPKAYSKRGVYNNIPADGSYYGVVNVAENFVKSGTILVDFNTTVTGTLALFVQDNSGYNPSPSYKLVKSWTLTSFDDITVIVAKDVLPLVDPGMAVYVGFAHTGGAGTEDIFVRWLEKLV